MSAVGRADDTREGNQSLWLLAAAPVVWAAHFALSYATVAVWCAKVAGRDGSLGPARAAVAAYTVVALAAIGAIAHHARGRYRYGGAREPDDADTAAGRHRFLGFAGLLLAGLSAVATLFAALAAVFIRSCQ